MTATKTLEKDHTLSTIRKSVLAVAIAAASTSAMAAPATMNFQFTPQVKQLELINDSLLSLNISGESRVSGDDNNDSVNLYGVFIDEDLTFTGRIFADGPFADGIDLDRSAMGSGPGVSIDGNFVNKGSISVTGLGSHGVITDSSSMGGFVNEGTISARDPNSDIDSAGVVGVEFSNSRVVEFDNRGSITVEGANAVGVYSAPNDNDQFTGARINRFINSGTISASGISSAAVALTDTLVNEGIENSGTISASGAESMALDFDKGTIQYIRNAESGVISSSNGSTAALNLDGAYFLATHQGEPGGVINRGTIQSDGVAIRVENPDIQGQEVRIQQYGGLIKGGETAIDGGNFASLLWNRGKIVGNLINLTTVDLRGENLLFEGDQIKAATINLETGKLTVTGTNSVFTGDLNMGADTVLELLVGGSTAVDAPILTVTGGVTVGANSAIALEARKNDFLASKSQYTILNAGSITGAENLTVRASSQLLEVTNVVIDEGTVTATVEGKGNEALAASIKAGGGSNNAVSAAQSFAGGVMGQLDENDPVFQAFANADTEEELADLAEQLTPEVNSGSNNAALNSQNLVNNAIGNRSAAGRGAAGGDFLAEKGLWAQALTSDAEQDMRNGIEGFNADSNGIAIGADGKLSESTTIGLAYSYLTTDVSGDDGNKVDVKGHALTFYGNWEQGNWFADAGMTFGTNDNESKRYVAGTAAKGDYDSDLFGLNVLAGYTYRMNDQLVVEPQVGARYSNIESESYSEKGSAAALNIGSQRFEIGEVGAGARVAGSYPLGKGLLEPEAKVMLWHDLIGDAATTTSTFALGGTPFTTNGTTADRNSVQAGVGVNYKVGAWSVGANYDYLTKTDFNADTLTAKVRYDF